MQSAKTGKLGCQLGAKSSACQCILLCVCVLAHTVGALVVPTHTSVTTGDHVRCPLAQLSCEARQGRHHRQCAGQGRLSCWLSRPRVSNA